MFTQRLSMMVQWALPLLAVLVLVSACVEAATPTPAPTATATATPAPVPMATSTPTGTPIPSPVPPQQTQAFPNISDVVDRVAPSVVAIVAQVETVDIFQRRRMSASSGTGVIFTKEGHILTNNHVVENAAKLTVTLFNERKVEASVVGTDPTSDLAVLKIPPADDVRPAILGDASKLRVGDWVIAIGNALALPGGPTVTVGVVGALGRSIPLENTVAFDLIQTDADINPGNSGGPLLNLAGEVVGINTAILRGSQSSDQVITGINFAISTETVKPVAEQLLQKGRVVWPWLGVFIEDVTPVNAAELGLTVSRGILVRRVEPLSPAERGGVKAVDVIIAIGGQEIDTVRQLQKVLRQEHKVGDEVTVSLVRGDKRLEVRAVLGEMPRR